jgi:hypothetical protein
MGKLIKLNQDESDAAQEFADLVAGGKITQGMACYRTHEGEIHYLLINPAHLSYIIGLMERTKMYIIDMCTEEVEEDE